MALRAIVCYVPLAGGAFASVLGKIANRVANYASLMDDAASSNRARKIFHLLFTSATDILVQRIIELAIYEVRENAPTKC